MAGKVVQVRFSVEEFAMLEEEASEYGITVAQLVRIKTTKDASFLKQLDLLVENAKKLPSGMEVTAQVIYGRGWNDLTKGERLSLGRAFLELVKLDRVPNLEPLGSSEQLGATVWYRSL